MVLLCQQIDTAVTDLLLKPDRMEALSRAYVSAIAASAGYSMGHIEPDRDSLDALILAKGEMRPQIGLQLKATSGIAVTNGPFTFVLSVKNYEDLRVKTQSPRLLIVVSMPVNEADWLHHHADHLILRRCAYWKSLLGEPQTSNTSTVSVAMHTSQVFDAPTLTSLMDKSRAGIPL